MSEKYELNINIDEPASVDTSGIETVQENSRKDNRSNVFSKPRTRNRKFSMDVFDGVKDSLGDKAYNKVLSKSSKKPGGINGKALRRAQNAAFSVAYGFNQITSLASNLITTTTSNIGTFTSNQANQNYVDNIASSVTGTLSTIGTIGSAAAAGGIAGAVIAAIGVTANKALEVANSAMKLSKENTVRNEESNRVRSRLGYIESGYSR